jgi:protein-L-isoaspartate(D-aspartate) O-methyltransferase
MEAARIAAGLVAVVILGTLAVCAMAEDDRAPERALMVQAIQQMALPLGRDVNNAGFDPRVLAALESVPRHEFVPRELSHMAYTIGRFPLVVVRQSPNHTSLP